MKYKKLFLITLVFSLVLLFLNPNKSNAGWAYQFVVWDGFVYVIGDEFVEEVDGKIGRVTKYNDMEGTYSGNFSNVYKKGTAYYSIKGISTDEAIAVEDGGGKYKKAVRDGEYAGDKNILGLNTLTMIIGFLVLLLIFILPTYLKRRKRISQGQ